MTTPTYAELFAQLAAAQTAAAVTSKEALEAALEILNAQNDLLIEDTEPKSPIKSQLVPIIGTLSSYVNSLSYLAGQ